MSANATTSRRNFLKSAAMAAASALAADSVFGEAVNPVPPGGNELPVLPNVTWDKAPCRFCGTGCHVMVGVQDGKVVAVTGDRQAEVNKGLLCVKGYHVGMVLYGADRLKTPLLRKNGELVPISWDEAIAVIAERIHTAPQKFAIYGSGQWTIPEGYAANKFIKGGLSNNHIDPNARLCMASAVTGYISTFGVDEPYNCYDDLDHCDTLLLWGNNFAEMHPVLFSRVVDRRLRGESIELIDLTTRHTRTSQQANHVLVMQPQSDLAIANCIAHQLIERNAWDREFVEGFCNFRGPGTPASLKGEPITFEQYRAEVSQYTIERTSEISGLSPQQLTLLADRFADKSRKVLSLWCMGVNQHTQGTAMNNLLHAIHLLSGHFGRPGDGPQSLTGQPSACGTVREVGTLAHALPGGLRVDDEKGRQIAEENWKLPAGRINPQPGYHTVLMWEKFCSPSDTEGALDTLWVQVTNPGQSLPNLHKLFNRKADLDGKFLIVSDVYPTATTELADLILPSAMWVEKNGIFGNSERRTQQWYRMVSPPGEARDDCWQMIAVAHKLFELNHEGMKDRDGNFLFTQRDESGSEIPLWEWEHYYDINIDERLYEEYRQFTRIKHKDLAPYPVLAKARGLRWPVVELQDGTWKETRYRFVEGTDPYVEPAKRFQFYHSVTGDDRALIWFRPYVVPPEVPDEEFPFWLDTGRVLEHWHTGTMTMRIPQLQKAMPTAYVEINRDDASELGIRNGDAVKLITRRGELTLPAWIDGRASCPPGHLFVPFFDEKLLVNQLTLEAHCPFSKEPDYKKCAARIERVTL
ncbi:MAG: molybdopterin-dependent oxidoreductase [Planctomycetaceae bacterium]|nr:molybdopterin-dependent oxidoreductase [Planctomycetaceae bacterium]